MAVGDLISETQNTTFSFQPAAGVVVCITQFLTTDSNVGTSITGVGDINTSTSTLQTSREEHQNGTYYLAQWAGKNFKFFIDNSSYLNYSTTGQYVGYSGVQTQ